MSALPAAFLPPLYAQDDRMSALLAAFLPLLSAQVDRRQRPANSRYHGTKMTTETQRTPETNREDIRRFQKNLDDEIDGIAIYELLAQAERDPERKRIFEELALVEVRHADVWRKKLREAGA